MTFANLPDLRPMKGTPVSDAQSMNLAANVIRRLAADGVQTANSGHPGMPMGMADAALVLWTKFLRFDPQDPAGRTAIGSCCRRGTVRCCCTRCCTCRATT